MEDLLELARELNYTASRLFFTKIDAAVSGAEDLIHEYRARRAQQEHPNVRLVQWLEELEEKRGVL